MTATSSPSTAGSAGRLRFRSSSACACIAVALAAAAPANATPIHVRVFHFVDRSRTIRLKNGSRIARPLVTVVRYPASAGSHPLIVFAHGFALTPAPYSRLLRAWASAGFVVAAPVFPLENANAPGGPTESDLVNEPRDLSVVIDRLLSGVLAGEIDPTEIAVAGHSDGGVAALAVAYDRRFRDRRIRAAIVMSAAPLPGMGGFPPHGPPLLAAQGTADPINPPATTASYFGLAGRPKFLLWLLGASHRPPYTDEEPQLGIVERATIDFLAHYLEGRPLSAFEQAARRTALTRLVAEP
jgi:predicted dienelactone hydrolase